jgi:hypothetical protein
MPGSRLYTVEVHILWTASVRMSNNSVVYALSCSSDMRTCPRDYDK